MSTSREKCGNKGGREGRGRKMERRGVESAGRGGIGRERWRKIEEKRGEMEGRRRDI